ncbi:MFS general substrate transporter [Ramaria rubella]|nr:MFS general substrate transporter [Ramaria rubella]
MPSFRMSKGSFFRGLALLCACSLSIGSHFGQNTLGPLKSRLSREKSTSSSEFSLLIAAFGLNSTWTPLVGGLLVSRLGTTRSSIIATSLIFAGQLILLFGELSDSLIFMLLGMFIFGLGISPLAVVQETIIVRFFNGRGLGVSLALGLVAGKSASFVSARTSFPLSEWNPHAPFVISTLLAGMSFIVNLLYVASSKWIAREAGVGMEDAEIRQANTTTQLHPEIERVSEEEALQKVAAKRSVKLNDLTRMGDVFWLYIAVNVLCGTIWIPFTHLAPNLIENRYGLSEGQAAAQGSILLAGPIVLYPLCGYITDTVKKGNIVHRLLILASTLTLFCYVWLAMPPSLFHTALPAMISFGLGHGCSPLLLVLIVPQLVPLQYVSTALGAHKSIESSGSTIMQTIAGLILDVKGPGAPKLSKDNSSAIQLLLNLFLSLNVIQLAGVYWLVRTDRARRKGKAGSGHNYREDATGDENVGLMAGAEPPERAIDDRRPFHGDQDEDTREREGEDHITHPPTSRDILHYKQENDLHTTNSERRRGRIFAFMAAGIIFFAWFLFMTSAVLDIRTRT